MINNLTILCGGQSKRMGEDKAQLIIHGETLLQRHIRLAQEAGMQVYIASGEQQYDCPVAVKSIEDACKNAGPLSAIAGALTTLSRHGQQASYFMPVDTLIQPEALVKLLSERLPAPYLCLTHLGQPQPLLSYASTEILPRITQWLAQGIRAAIPLTSIHGSKLVVMPPAWQTIYGFNTPDAWQVAQAHIPLSIQETQ